jgi:hypothetical protein
LPRRRCAYKLFILKGKLRTEPDYALVNCAPHIAEK